MRASVVLVLAAAFGCGPRDGARLPTPPPPPIDAPIDAPIAPPDCPPTIVELRDVEQLRVAVAGCNGNAFDGRRTALMAAAERGDLLAVEVLLRAGANPDASLEAPGSADAGKTALWFAIETGSAEVVERLLAAQADPNRYPPSGLPLLVLAVLQDSVPIARLLVSSKVDAKQTTRRGATAMTYANGPSAEMFAYLTSAGVAADGLAPEVVESLRWEAANAPKPDAAPDALVGFAIEVLAKTRSARSREAAIKRLQHAGPAAKPAVHALVDVVRGNPLSPTDWSSVRAVEALKGIGWGPALTRELGRLVDAMPAAPQQQRLALVELFVAAPRDTRRVIVKKLRVLATRARDRAELDRAIGTIEGVTTP